MPSAAPAAFGGDLHHAAAAVGQQEVVLAVLLVDDHVERAVAVAQLGDGRPLDVGARLQLGDGDLHQRRAGVGRQQVGLVADLVGHERPDRRLGLEPAVGAVVDLDRGAVEAFAERERDGDQPGGELLVGQAGDEDAAVDVGEVGDRLVAERLARAAWRSGRARWGSRPWRTGRSPAAPRRACRRRRRRGAPAWRRARGRARPTGRRCPRSG